MSGIRSGSRVEQLEQLLARVQQELAVERQKQVLDARKAEVAGLPAGVAIDMVWLLLPRGGADRG